jgi:uncharacterized protein (TIGR02001 family)
MLSREFEARRGHTGNVGDGAAEVVTRSWPALVFVAVALLIPAPAAAQVAGSVGLDSDYRLRGYSLSDGGPAASAQLSYDDPSGLYLSLSGLAEVGRANRFLGVIANAGFAKRLSGRLTVDGGVLRSQIRSAVRDAPGYQYTELYAGAYVGPVAGHVYYSPGYRYSGSSSLYAELETGFEPARNWRLSGHVGMLTYLGSSSYRRQGDGLDWRVSVSRQLGALEIHSALSGTASRHYSRESGDRRIAWTVGGAFNF